MSTLNETQEIFNHAKENDYMDFKEKAIELLKQKTAEKMAERGYFDRMNKAQGITEGCDKKVKEEEEENEEEENEEEE